MEKNFLTLLFLLPIFAFAQEPIDYVNPFIGTGGHGHTFPGACMPFGMVQVSPDTRTDGWDACSGYYYTDNEILGFSHTHLSGTGVRDLCDVMIQPEWVENNKTSEGYSPLLRFEKTNEYARPGYYKVLTNGGILAEMTATVRSGWQRFSTQNKDGYFLLHIFFNAEKKKPSDANMDYDPKTGELSGFLRNNAWANKRYLFFYGKLPVGKIITHNERELVIQCSEKEIVTTMAFSSVSEANAERNFSLETSGKAFDNVRKYAEYVWNNTLSAVKIDGGTAAEKMNFYTALYHCYIHPSTWSDTNGEYRGLDGEVHKAVGYTHYTIFSLWDTYRALHPLLTLLEPKRSQDFVKSLLADFKQQNRLPVWELHGRETDCMIGYHAISVIADAWLRMPEMRTPELQAQIKEAFETTAAQDGFGLKFYKQYGYVPADKESESVSKTAEYAYDDACIAAFLKSVGDADAAHYNQRAGNYKHLYDKGLGFFRPLKNVAFIAPFNPFEVNYHFTEANAWQYSFSYQQDIANNTENIEKHLNEIFSATSVTTGRDQADMTGRIGQYVHGNEPSHHIPYLFNALEGQEWKTQYWIGKIRDSLYMPTPDGLCGNEDCGQMSAWYVLSSLGLYPLSPGVSTYWEMTTPLFPKMEIKLPEDKKLVLLSASEIIRLSPSKAKYIDKIIINKSIYDSPRIDITQLAKGDTVLYELTNAQNTGAFSNARYKKEKNLSALDFTLNLNSPRLKDGIMSFKKSKKIEFEPIYSGNTILYYSIGDEPFKIYEKPFDLESSAKLRAYYELSVEPKGGGAARLVRSDTVEADFFKINEKIKVEYLTSFAPQYTADGANTLIDGNMGQADFRCGAYQGWDGENMSVVIDLGKKPQPVSQLTAHFLHDHNSWIFAPVSMTVEYSDNGKDFTKLETVKSNFDLKKEGSVLLDLSTQKTDAPLVKRFWRITAENLKTCPDWHKGSGYKCWVFCSEIGF